MKKLIALLPLSVALAACGSLKPKDVQAEVDYVCENGVSMRVAEGNNRIKLTALNVTGNPSTVLQQAPAGEGVRYANNDGFFGQPSEWRVQNGETVLTYSSNGESIQTKCQIK
ncbi:MliC family protein [Uruburuella testudinis]|uniref:MliC family protein n=1 Tax=Uruburuella testudinis TaxID=1282863 RepID=A0ABY4E1M8_9NEIS|nr:MliC family protein [Uruburuella testudinis]UOO82866.1 MliC family protein [Uruburuella testudinis]